MPWDVKKMGDKYAVVKKGSGKVVAKHDSEESAKKQVRALYAQEGSNPRIRKA